MSAPAAARPARRGLGAGAKRGILAGVIVVLLVFVVLGTRVVSNDAADAGADEGFNAEAFGAERFPGIQEAIAEKAVDADELAQAIAADAEAAVEEYAVPSSGGPVFSVTFTGTVGEGQSGIYDVAVDGLPDDLLVRVQTGPAINGTELRDATGDIVFGEFTNQIEFQNAAAALNDEMKVQVLDSVDAASLEGSTVTVTGAFTLINEAAWLVTPAHLEAG
ncbi:DUF2291 family protein [Microbacterium sp. JB110]|uniref:DUF2291 family protein n=1 Tax=Microbacterium sp. JB110 TaxID=2024477 RepID=UPI00097EFD2C|nr:DUF2291 family protein [Microbacterium sp. JB110]SJM44601.1 Predicted erythritol ABC transporter 2, hypothetical lipoprotein [Frigoribacterium sp. JB110]